MLSLPKCNSSMCSELIPGFSVLKRFSSCSHAHLWPQTAAVSEHPVLGPNMMQTLLCLILSCIRVVLSCPASHGRGKQTASRTQTLFHDLLGNGGLQTLAEKRRFVTVVTMGFWYQPWDWDRFPWDILEPVTFPGTGLLSGFLGSSDSDLEKSLWTNVCFSCGSLIIRPSLGSIHRRLTPNSKAKTFGVVRWH